MKLKKMLYLALGFLGLALGALVTGPGLAMEIVDIFLDTPFSGEEKHARRIGKITEMELRLY